MLGDEHPLVAASMDNHAGVLARLGRMKEATETATEAFSLAERSLGPDNPEMALFHANVGMLQAQQGDHAGAIEHLTRAIEIQGAAFSPEHPSLVGPLESLGAVLLEEGRRDEALAALRRAWAVATSQEVQPILGSKVGLDLAQALSSDPETTAEAVEIAIEARTRLQAAGENGSDELEQLLDEWLRAHGGDDDGRDHSTAAD